MTGFLAALSDPEVRSWYLIFCMALMVLPMIGLSVWYHRNINKTPGGSQLMERQNRSNVQVRGSLNQANRQLQDGLGMARDISAGKYGTQSRSMQHIVYWLSGAWLVANAVAFGLLIYADEVNRPSAAPELQGEVQPAAPSLNENPVTSE